MIAGRLSRMALKSSLSASSMTFLVASCREIVEHLAARLRIDCVVFVVRITSYNVCYTKLLRR